MLSVSDRIKKIPVDIKTGVTDAIAHEIASFLGFQGAMAKQCAEQVFLLVLLVGVLHITTLWWGPHPLLGVSSFLALEELASDTLLYKGL